MLNGQSYIDGQWIDGNGDTMSSINPCSGEPFWHGRESDAAQVARAVDAASAARSTWANTPLADRIDAVIRFRAYVERQRDELTDVLRNETGKPRWEAKTEVAAIIGKVQLSIDAYHERRAEQSAIVNGVQAVTAFRPHGAVAVLGPFNLPGHLPNGHILPALIAGNTVVFKPSELTPAMGELLVHCLHEAGLPPGVVNLVQGGRPVGEQLVEASGIDGVYFTGGCKSGMAIQQSLVRHPHRILALELGGNNPLVVAHVNDTNAAALTTIQSAFITAGQRCTCARRLIVCNDDPNADRFLTKLTEMTDAIVVGRPDDDPPPFIGPVINAASASRLLEAQATLCERGGQSIVPMRRTIAENGGFLKPGLIDVTEVRDREDVELFGPLLQLIRVADFDAAIAEANNTAFGLSAGLLSNRPALWQQFFREIRAGIINWNRPTTGASGRLPFGGIGRSGNHRPAGYYAVDCCAYPVASMQSSELSMPDELPPGLTA